MICFSFFYKIVKELSLRRRLWFFLAWSRRERELEMELNWSIQKYNLWPRYGLIEQLNEEIELLFFVGPF